MIVFHKAEEMRSWSADRRSEGDTIGFVPTMGYLHDGHLSLVKMAREQCNRVVVSIYVNPTQFSPGEDLDTYPRSVERDSKLLEKHQIDALYLPSNQEMYPEGYRTYVNVEELGEWLCGASRPGHFRGVTTVVTKLFHTVLPQVAFFGRKDAQQARIIQQMTKDLQFGIDIVLGETVREPDGLAMSSRNVRLSTEHRKQAPAIYQALNEAKDLFKSGEQRSESIISKVSGILEHHAPGGVIDYIELVDWDSLTPVEIVSRTGLLATAVRFGEVRLIDNIILEKV